MTLITLLNKANQAYSDGFLSEYYETDTGAPKQDGGDSLARYIVNEIRETYVEVNSSRDQVAEARRVIMNAMNDLQGVHDALGELR